MDGDCHLMSLPTEIITHIFTFCNYDNISQLREVCKTFDHIGKQMLNRGFVKVDKFHTHIQKLVKSKLPRRESERRNHHLSKHVITLSAIETRLSLLNMTYVKYIDTGLFCFIPGRVLDELLRVLRTLEDTTNPPRTHELLQELRDISSMAMEHFDDKILPEYKDKLPLSGILPSKAVEILTASLPEAAPPITPASGTGVENLPNWSLRHIGEGTSHHIMTGLHPDLLDIRNRVRDARNLISANRSISGKKREVKEKTKCEHEKRQERTEHKLRKQSHMVRKLHRRLVVERRKVKDISQALVEYDHKFNELYREIGRLRAELGMESSDAVNKALTTVTTQPLIVPHVSSTTETAANSEKFSTFILFHPGNASQSCLSSEINKHDSHRKDREELEKKKPRKKSGTKLNVFNDQVDNHLKSNVIVNGSEDDNIAPNVNRNESSHVGLKDKISAQVLTNVESKASKSAGNKRWKRKRVSSDKNQQSSHHIQDNANLEVLPSKRHCPN